MNNLKFHVKVLIDKIDHKGNNISINGNDFTVTLPDGDSLKVMVEGVIVHVKTQIGKNTVNIEINTDTDEIAARPNGLADLVIDMVNDKRFFLTKEEHEKKILDRIRLRLKK